MIVRYLTRKGELLWFAAQTGQPILGRKEIARLQFDRYLLKKAVKEKV